MVKKYRIDFTEQQLRVVATGLEFYSRFLAGQWDIPNTLQWKEYTNRGKPDNFWNVRNIAQVLVNRAKQIFLNNMDGSYAIGSDLLHEDAKVSYDVYRPILEIFAKESKEKFQDETFYSVYDYEGLTYSKEGRIKIERVE